MKKNNEKYNRLELILLSCNNYDLMEFQPYSNKNLYILQSTDFILYDIQPTEEKIIEFIRRIVTNQIKIEKPNEERDGYFGDNGFGEYCSYDDIVIFNFLFIAKGMEHLAIPFTYFDPCEGVESFGYLYDGTILNAKETTKYIEELKKIEEIQRLEKIATVSFEPVQNFADIFENMNVENFIVEYFGKLETAKEVSLKFRELSKIHHPDAGGDTLMFRAIANAKQYLIDSINYTNGELPALA